MNFRPGRYVGSVFVRGLVSRSGVVMISDPNDCPSPLRPWRRMMLWVWTLRGGMTVMSNMASSKARRYVGRPVAVISSGERWYVVDRKQASNWTLSTIAHEHRSCRCAIPAQVVQPKPTRVRQLHDGIRTCFYRRECPVVQRFVPSFIPPENRITTSSCYGFHDPGTVS